MGHPHRRRWLPDRRQGQHRLQGRCDRQQRQGSAGRREHGGNLNITATGQTDASGRPVAGTGDLTALGSTLSGKNVSLTANNDVLLASAQTTTQQQSTNSSSGFSAGVGLSLGEQTGISVFASAQRASGNANGDSVTHVNTNVTASDTLTVRSGRDATLYGAQASGGKIVVDVGRNLTITSPQDTDTYHSKQSSASGGVSVTFGPGGGASGSIGLSRDKINSDYQSVGQQSGLMAGSGGFDVHVGEHTQLNAGVISSTADASKNKLDTGTLGFTDLQNRAEYKAEHSGLNIGYSSSGSLGKNLAGNALANAPSGLGLAGTNGEASGTTRAAVSDGTIVVRDQANQKQDVATLSRDTANANGSVQKIFDLKQVQERVELGREFGKLGMQVAGDVAGALAKQNPDSGLWKEGEPGRIALHAAIAAIGAAMTGGDVAGAVAGTVAGDLAAKLIEKSVQEATKGLPPSVQATVANVITNVVAGTAGAVVGGAVGGSQGAVSGAGGALAADMFNRQLHPDERKQLDELKKGRSATEQQRLEDAACAMTHCALGLSDDNPDKAAKLASEQRGKNYLPEQRELSGTGQFTYSNSMFGDLGRDLQDRYKDWITQKLVSVNQSLDNAVSSVNRGMQNAGNVGPHVTPSDIDQITGGRGGGNTPSGSAGATVVPGAVPCAPGLLCPVPVVVPGAPAPLPDNAMASGRNGDEGAKSGAASNSAATSGGTANAATGQKLNEDLASKMSKPLVSDPKLSVLMDDLYRDGAKIGSGSTADAVRYENATNQNVGGVFHREKAENYSRALQRWLDNNPDASFSDRSAAQLVLRDMQNALRGK
ncbi:hypothetical protein FUT88_23125 [Ralstonia sp. TCR112]|nr:hypothetical protein FUT88_23125 [Ralstonia sp. TCR112]